MGNGAAEGSVTACVLLIGDELLSGRTKDANLSYIARYLGDMGIQVREARMIPDVEAVIVETLNEVRAAYDYVFTTGGIGPTHDDITADCVAKAFGVPIGHHPEAMAILTKHYEETGNPFTEARKRMARIPEGASLIPNPVSKAPGFQMENVFVMAGIPMIMQVMMDGLAGRLKGGRKMLSATVSCEMGEGQLAEGLGTLQAAHPDVSIGSYPFFVGKRYGTSIVMRSVDEAALASVQDRVRSLMRELGAVPIEGDVRAAS
ncbi:competence/damage-inducible protein A [Tepidicaulis sp.]|uniref:competence/damage-inducible protein A n=1 Tax=Tepidicaulis sp. TaxID=1920809 RepID=UPI003B58FA07